MKAYQIVIVLIKILVYTIVPVNQAALTRLCGRHLTEALNSVCKDSGYYAPPAGSARAASSQGGVSFKCCKNYCDPSILQTFCNLPPTIQSPTTTTTTIRTTTRSLLFKDKYVNEIDIDNTIVDQVNTRSESDSDRDNMDLLDDDFHEGVINKTAESNSNETTIRDLDELNNVTGDASNDTISISPSNIRAEGGKTERTTTKPAEDEVTTNCRGHSKERARNKTGRSSERKHNSSRRKPCSSAERKSRKKARKEQKKHKSRRRKVHGSAGKTPGEDRPLITPPVVTEAGNSSRKNIVQDDVHTSVNNTRGADGSSSKKKHSITTITAVLRGPPQPSGGNR